MNLEVFDVIVFVTGAAIGLIVGLSIKGAAGKWLGGTSEQNPSEYSGFTPDSLQNELDRKQVMIDDFFNETNVTLKQTERLMASLRNKLASGAQQLSSIELPSVRIDEGSAHSSNEQPIEPPKDYALKRDQQDSGTLSEGYGLNKADEESKLKPEG